MNASAGVRKDCAREKKAKPIMYAMTITMKRIGDWKGRVSRMRAGSNPRL